MRLLVLLDPKRGRTEPIELEDEPLKRDGNRAQGGEGKVYAPRDRSGCVAKIYNLPDDMRRRHKIEAMLAARPGQASVKVKGAAVDLLAWPTHILLYEDRRFAGFLMPRVPADFEGLSLWHLRGDKASKGDQRRPLDDRDRSLPSRVAGCRNLARLVQSVHELGHWVIDLNAPNIFVQRGTMRVCLIDCDGFSIAVDGKPVHRDTAVKAESLAPERHRSDGVKLEFDSDAQDRFALALAIFQWLNHGIHPFQGRPLVDDENPWTIQANLQAWRYAYGLISHPELAPMPASDHDTFPPVLRRLFDRAFARDAAADRPSATEWAERLHGLKVTHQFEACALAPEDPLHIHFRDMPCPRCRVLERRRAAVADAGAAAAPSSQPASFGSVPRSGASNPGPGVRGATGGSMPRSVLPPPPPIRIGRRALAALALAAAALTLASLMVTGLWPWQLFGVV